MSCAPTHPSTPSLKAFVTVYPVSGTIIGCAELLDMLVYYVYKALKNDYITTNVDI